MTTFTSQHREQKLAELEELAKRAWADYTDALRDLQGRDYEDAEDRSWDRLQKELRELDEQRQLVGET